MDEQIKTSIGKPRNKKPKEQKEYDILKIDESIRESFSKEYDNIGSLHHRLSSAVEFIKRVVIPYGITKDTLDFISSLPSSNKIIITEDEDSDDEEEIEDEEKEELVLSYSEFNELCDNISKIIISIENIESNKLLNKYNELTQPVLDEYKKLLSIPIKTSFMSGSGRVDIHKERKDELKQLFLRIASDFVYIDYVEYSPEKSDQCECGSNKFEITNGTSICECCGIVNSLPWSQSSFKDTDRVNIHQTYKYEKKSHFKEGVRQFQGKQNKVIDPSVYTKADTWLLMHNLLVKDAETKKEKYSKVTKDHIRIFLAQSKKTEENLTKHYEDIHLIHSNLTGVPLHDISHLEEKLYYQFDLIVEAFESMDINRSNLLNSQFILKKLLQYNGYNVDSNDFPDLKTL